MGIPDEDRLENVCRTDMASIERSVSAVRTALGNVESALPHTWIGKKADDWRTDYEGRVKRLKALFDSFPAEEGRLVDKAREKQSAMDRKRMAGG